MDTKAFLIVVVLFVLLTSCAGLPEKSTEEVTPQHAPTQKDAFTQFKRESDRDSSQGRPDDSIRKLVRDAQTAERQGDIDKAISIVERAIRIQPQNAYLWYQLAQLQYEKGNYTKAIQLARRSDSFAGSDMQQRELNRQLIAQIESGLASP
ncbi:MAG: tetratricopeptide repeat protein [Gammaproteobacteria bacterium]|nr:tetratricopeptide repeat protein [Gammaproteobacteria bacterium]